mmetsp:Transcript_50686/g.156919  ORF Transcript_50686/g.156919 Transcript_50686/m.156919 type:complete len:131 (-) Transcript_50686:87-479(-)
MVTNDEGEVFWYIPRKESPPGAKPQKCAVTGMSPLPQPVCPDDEPPALPVDTPPGDGQASRGAGVLDARPGKERLPTPKRAPPRCTDPTTAAPAPREPNVDDDMHFVETPAPCLVSPTPAPGRRRSEHHL